MRRAVFAGAGQVSLEQLEAPVPRHGELLVRVHCCAICGSDRAAWETGSTVTPGHEVAGVVADRGAGASTPVGTRGAVFLVAYCDRCARCRDGGRGACLRREGMVGFTRDGGFAEYVAVPERCFLPVAPQLDLDDAVLLLDVTGTALHALRRAGALERPPRAAIVLGVGPVGLGAVLALRAVGVSRVVAVDVAAYRLELARSLGAELVAGGDGASEAIRDALPHGAPLVVEASGHPVAQRQALDLVAAGGRLVFVGHSRAPLEVWASRDLIEQEKTILGSEYFDPREFRENQALLLEGRLDPRPIVTHRLPLEDIADGYRLFWSGATGKVLVYPGPLPDA